MNRSAIGILLLILAGAMNGSFFTASTAFTSQGIAVMGGVAL